MSETHTETEDTIRLATENTQTKAEGTQTHISWLSSLAPNRGLVRNCCRFCTSFRCFSSSFFQWDELNADRLCSSLFKSICIIVYDKPRDCEIQIKSRTAFSRLMRSCSRFLLSKFNDFTFIASASPDFRPYVILPSLQKPLPKKGQSAYRSNLLSNLWFCRSISAHLSALKH